MKPMSNVGVNYLGSHTRSHHPFMLKFSRYSIGLDEKFTKVVSQDKKEFLRTSTNVTWVRHNLMREMDELVKFVPRPRDDQWD